MSKIIGIDLGTSTSEAAVLLDGKMVMIENEQKESIIPSVIGLDEEENLIVGAKAAERLVLYPEKTAIEIKRKMGSDEKISLGKKILTPVEASAEILSYIKTYASSYLGEEIDRAVITVPAYFNDQQRKATVQAGEKAGLKVERIINEPTAAALCYGIDHLQEESHILVYDFGGGTFDVTLLEMFDGVLEVKASSGNNTLGGKDFDEKLMDYLIDRFLEKYKINLRTDIYAMTKLKEASVACKIALSMQDTYQIAIPFISSKDKQPLSLEETISVDIFESLIGELVEKTREPVQTVLNDSEIGKDEVDLILLIGGSTRIPYIQQYVENLFGKKPEQLIDPDLSVAMGAAVQAAMLDGKFSEEDGILITDVNPYALGVRIAGGDFIFLNDDIMDIIIPRNVTIPVSKKKIYTTCYDFQEAAEIIIYQGEQEKASENNYLGKFTVTDIPPAEQGKEKVEIKFSYDTNGILEVNATVVSSGNAANIIIDVHGTENAEKLDITEWKKAPKAIKYRSTIRKAEKLLKQGAFELEDGVDLEDDIYELKKALIEDREEKILDMIEKDILSILEDYM